jgi:hypothetical protein
MGSKGGANLIPLISNLDDLKAAMEGASVASNDAVASIQKANDEIDKMTMTLKTWGAGVVSYLVEGVQNAGERVGTILSGGVGKTIKELDADIERLDAKARLASKGVEDPKTKGNTLRESLNKTLGMVGIPMESFTPKKTLDYEKQVADEVAAMKAEAAAKEKAAAEKVANDKQAAIDKVKQAELAAFNEQVANTDSLITLTNEYNANLEGISATTNDANGYLKDQSLILNDNLSYTESIAGSTDKQTQYLEDQTRQLEIVKGLYDQIDTKENEAQKKFREKEEEKKQEKVKRESEKAQQEAQQAYDSSLTGQAFNQIDTAKKEYKVTQGGSLREKMNESMGRGDFNTAEIYANKIARNEAAYEKKQVSSMVKNRGMTQSQAEAAVSSEKTKNDPMGTLVKYTDEINTSVKEIAKNLPQKALTA